VEGGRGKGEGGGKQVRAKVLSEDINGRINKAYAPTDKVASISSFLSNTPRSLFSLARPGLSSLGDPVGNA
jgi:hypothetical protein